MREGVHKGIAKDSQQLPCPYRARQSPWHTPARGRRRSARNRACASIFALAKMQDDETTLGRLGCATMYQARSCSDSHAMISSCRWIRVCGTNGRSVGSDSSAARQRRSCRPSNPGRAELSAPPSSLGGADKSEPFLAGRSSPPGRGIDLLPANRWAYRLRIQQLIYRQQGP